MGLLMEFLQGLVGNLKGFTLSAESGVAQTRATLFKSRTLAATATFRALVAARFKLVFHAGARARIGLAAGSRVFAVTELTSSAGSCGLGLAHAGAVVAAHGDHGLGCGLGRRRRRGRCGCGLSFGHCFLDSGCGFFACRSGFRCSFSPGLRTGFRCRFSGAVGLCNCLASLLRVGRSGFGWRSCGGRRCKRCHR